MSEFFVSVDVGTASARAAVFDASGQMLGYAKSAIGMRRDASERQFEQDSEEIWQACCKSVRDALGESGVDPALVGGLAFDATCSLVLVDAVGLPLAISDEKWNVIVWMDQRAELEADLCSQTDSRVLRYLGGVMSPQMQLPKLMWLKRRRPDLWRRLGSAFDLADFLTWRATGSTSRSACTLTCKWTYLPHDVEHWDKRFLSQIDLKDLADRTGVSDSVVPVGKSVGVLSQLAADELGLTTSCVVASGLIDAHAGALGTLGHLPESRVNSTLALIAGSSNCHMSLSPHPRQIGGVWGPYHGAVMPEYWLNEGGQSASGLLLDSIVASHSAASALTNPHEELSKEALRRMRAGERLPEWFHVLPDVLGNRSPLADARMRGAIVGITIDDPSEQLITLYWAAAAAIAYGTRAIVEAMNRAGYEIDTIAISGGHAANPFLVALYGDVTGCKLISPAAEPVLLGGAIASAAATGRTIAEAARSMSCPGEVRLPDPSAVSIHSSRYARFETLTTFARSWFSTSL